MRVPVAAAVLLLLLAGRTSAVSAQSTSDLLGAARDLYANAVYEDALAMLARAGDPPAGSPASLKRDLEMTRALCLVALGRDNEARSAMEAVVVADPTFDLGASEAAPRIRELLRQARAKQLPAIVRAQYAAAKEAYDAHDYAAALARFTSLDALLRDPVFASIGTTEAGDLQVLVGGFRELSAQRQTGAGTGPGGGATAIPAGAGAKGEPDRVGATGVGAPPRPVGTSGQAEAGAPGAGSLTDAPARQGSTPTDTAQADVVPPVAVQQQAPAWSPSLGLVPGRVYQGIVEIVIDATGRVSSARIVESVSKAYDARLLEAVRRWRYRPATRGGVPVSITNRVSVTVKSP
jgi:TonB family protein